MTRRFNSIRISLLAMIALVVAIAVASVAAQKTLDPQTAVNNAFNQFRTLKEGKNADYIPALAKVDPNLFGIVLVTLLVDQAARLLVYRRLAHMHDTMQRAAAGQLNARVALDGLDEIGIIGQGLNDILEGLESLWTKPLLYSVRGWEETSV